MIRVALAGLLGRKLRTALTALAIVLGVAMVSGTLVLTDSIDKAFNFIYTDVRKGSDVVVTGKAAVSVTQGQGSFAPTIAQSVLAKVRALPDVALADGQRERDGAARGLGRQGDHLRRRAEPRLQHRQRRLAVQSSEAHRRSLAVDRRGRYRRDCGEE